LLSAVDRTATAAGARLLERWLAAPPLDLVAIRMRQAVVGELLAQPLLLAELHGLLGGVRDIPAFSDASRTGCGRRGNSAGSGRPGQLPAIIDCVGRIESAQVLSKELTEAPVAALRQLRLRVTDQPSLRELLNRALADELAGDLQEGGYIRAGYDAEVDRLRSLTRDSKTWLSDLERQEQERTGIKSLKVRFNSVFGYYLEITKANLHLVPSDYIRRQTTVAASVMSPRP